MAEAAEESFERTPFPMSCISTTTAARKLKTMISRSKMGMDYRVHLSRIRTVTIITIRENTPGQILSRRFFFFRAPIVLCDRLHMNGIKKSLFVITVSIFIHLTVAMLSNAQAQAITGQRRQDANNQKR